MYVVYGLEDQRNHEIFYVGITDDVQTRFSQHLRCDGTNPLKDARIRKMIDDGYLPLMRTLQLVPGLEQAKWRESYWMRHYYDLGLPLTNQVIPIIQDTTVIVAEANRKPRLKAQMTPDEQREYILYLLNMGMPKRRILEKVNGYIHSRDAYHIIDSLIGQPVLVHRSSPLPIDSTLKPVDDVDKLKQVRKMILEQRNQNEIICEVWGVTENTRAFRTAKEEFRHMLAYMASMAGE